MYRGYRLGITYSPLDIDLWALWQKFAKCLEEQFSAINLKYSCGVLIYQDPEDWLIDEPLEPTKTDIQRCEKDGYGICGGTKLYLYSLDLELKCLFYIFPASPGNEQNPSYAIMLELESDFYIDLFPDPESTQAEERSKSALLNIALNFGNAINAEGFYIGTNEERELSVMSGAEIANRIKKWSEDPTSMMDLSKHGWWLIIGLRERVMNCQSLIKSGWKRTYLLSNYAILDIMLPSQ
jgi:hypothetical protein